MASKILVCDDDTNICELLRLYLEKDQFTVILANDGEEALEKFKTENPDFVLLDIMMPKLDGWQVCREIRKKSDCPIIMSRSRSIRRRSPPESRQCCAVFTRPVPNIRRTRGKCGTIIWS